MIISADKITHNNEEGWFLLNDAIKAKYVEENGVLDVILEYDEALHSEEYVTEISKEFLTLVMQLSKLN